MSTAASRDGRPQPRLLVVANVAWFLISHRLPLVVGARAAGFDVHVAAGGATQEDISVFDTHGIPCHSLQLKRSARGLASNLALPVRLARLYRQLRPDIVHHVTVKPVLFGTLAARWSGVPAVVNAVSGMGYAFTAGEGRRAWTRRIVELGYRTCLRHPNMKVIVQNDDDAHELASVADLRGDQVVLIHGSGVDLSRFRVSPEPPSPPVVVLLPARMLRDKGVEEFAQAIRLLRDRGLAVEGRLAGGTDPGNLAAIDEPALRRMERECGVRWLGHQTDMPRLLSHAHIVCLPSYREGLPKALAEAAAAGRPIVTTNVPGCRDVVEHGVNGLLVPPRTVGSLADSIEALATDAGRRAAMGAAGRRRAEREFDVQAVVAQTLQVYSDLMHRRP